MKTLEPDTLQTIEAMVGLPYGPPQGVTCWGLVRAVYGIIGVTLPEDIFDADALFMSVDGAPQPFDVLIFLNAVTRQRHLGVLLDYPRLIHCSEATNGVALGELTRDYFRATFKRSVRLKEWPC